MTLAKIPKIQPSRPYFNPYSATSVPLGLRTSKPIKKRRSYNYDKSVPRIGAFGRGAVPRCKVQYKSGYSCRRWAIKGTGVCWKHGGGQARLAIIRREALEMERLEQESANKITQAAAGEKKEFYPSDLSKKPKYNLTNASDRQLVSIKRIHPDILNMREELVILQAELQKVLNSPAEYESACPHCKEPIKQKARKVNDILSIVTKMKEVVQVIHDMEEGRKILITRENLQIQLVKIIKVVKKYIPDEGMQHLVAKEFAEITRNVTGKGTDDKNI